MSWCDKCEMENCEHTTGAGKRHDESLKGTYDYFAGYRPPYERASAEPARNDDERRGPTIQAKFNGWCKGCGRAFDEGTTITHSRDHDGWIAGCCA